MSYRSVRVSPDNKDLDMIDNSKQRRSNNSLPNSFLGALVCLSLILCHQVDQIESASARTLVRKQNNQYFLNEFCDLHSKAYKGPRTYKQSQDTRQVHLDNTNIGSSMKVSPQKPKAPSSVSFGFGSSGGQGQLQPIIRQLNCSIIVVAPPHNGLLINVNSFGLPKNLTRLGITLNHGSNHSQQIHLEGADSAETSSSQYLLNREGSSKIAINLQSFEPIDWSQIHFDIVVNVFRKADNDTGCPNKKWFHCGDDICIPSWLVCDGARNCPNGNDEMLPYHCYSPLFLSIAASSALALLLILAIVAIILFTRRRSGLNKQNRSLSDSNVLTADGDFISHDGNNSSKLDLTQESAARSGSYFKTNLYLGGFENPVWSTGTLTKQSQKQTPAGANKRPLEQAEQEVTVESHIAPSASTSSTTVSNSQTQAHHYSSPSDATNNVVR